MQVSCTRAAASAERADAVVPVTLDPGLPLAAARLKGSVRIATPLSWQLISYFLLAGVGVSIGFLSMASYARIETARGAVTLDKGVLAVVPSRAGVIEAVRVREGDTVAAGQLLLTVRAAETLSEGGSAPERIEQAIASQDARMVEQTALLGRASSAERERLRAQITGARAELSGLEAQIADQVRLVTLAEADFADVKRISSQGFISRRDIEAREAALLSRRQQLAALRQQLGAKLGDIRALEASIAQSNASVDAQAAAVASTRASLRQQTAQSASAKGYGVTAPLAGRVTALLARPGSAARVNQPFLTIIPSGATMRAEISLPSRAVGFVTPGQEVRVSLDAFPYERFGAVSGRILQVSSAPVPRSGDQPGEEIYLATVALPRPWVMAFGKRRPLLPGMGLTARIVTERRSLIEWLFEPLFAMRRR